MKLCDLKDAVLSRCAPGARCRICNDGSMAAFTAAMELAAAGEDALISDGVIAHSLGTDLGTGWLLPDGSIPPIPLELYDLLLTWAASRPLPCRRRICAAAATKIPACPACAAPSDRRRPTASPGRGTPRCSRALWPSAMAC